MHLLKAIDDYDVFARSLSSAPRRWSRSSSRTSPCTCATQSTTTSCPRRPATEVVTIGRLVNVFFRWEFNSCETLVKGGEVYPIDYANACPDVALDQPALLLPLGDQGPGQVVRLRAGDGPTDQA